MRRFAQVLAIATLMTACGADGDGGAFSVAEEGEPPAWNERSPAFSPDGRAVAFTSDRADGKSFDVWVVGSDGGSTRRLTRLPRARYPLVVDALEWSPDGTRVAFTSGELVPKYTFQRRALYVADVAKGRVLRLRVPNPRVEDFAWAPDGDQLAVESVGAEPDAPFRVDIVSADGRRSTRVVEHASDGSFLGFEWSRERITLFWIDAIDVVGGASRTRIPLEDGTDVGDVSPDGSKLVVESGYEIWTMNLAGRARRRLTETEYADLGPVWSPDGKAVAFATTVDVAKNEIRVARADGSGTRTVVSDDGNVEYLGVTWSPRGTWLAYLRNGEPWMLDVARDERRRAPIEFDWSPDDRLIVFPHPRSYERDDPSALYVMNLRTGAQRRLTGS